MEREIALSGMFIQHKPLMLLAMESPWKTLNEHDITVRKVIDFRISWWRTA